MSRASWLRAHYPIPAHKVAKKDAAAHSLRKWEGFLKKNLKKHRVFLVSDDITPALNDIDGEFLDIDAESCALCVYHFNMRWETKVQCSSCPLREVLGGVCDAHYDSPYIVFLNNLDPKHMIRALRKAVALENKKRSKK